MYSLHRKSYNEQLKFVSKYKKYLTMETLINNNPEVYKADIIDRL